MHSSFSLSKCMVYVHILVMQLLIRLVSTLNITNAYLHHKCIVHQGAYMHGSEYQKNLNYLTRDLSTHKFPDGFIHITKGKAPNSVTVVFQCRGDSYGSKCRSGFSTAVAGLNKRCMRNKTAIIWYDHCFLSVSTINRSQMKIDYENTFPMYNPNKMNIDTKLFNKMTKDLLYKLMLEADKSDKEGNEMLYYATGEKILGKKKLYAMVQCALDTTFCGDCLKWSIRELSKCCDDKKGARILGTSCNLMYELYPFVTT